MNKFIKTYESFSDNKKLTKNELEKLSDDEIRDCFKIEDRMLLPSPVKEYVEKGKVDFTMGEKFNEVEKILMEIIVDRFLSK